MKTYTATLKGNSPYSQSRHYVVPDLEKEQPGDKDRRTWRERMHTDATGEVFIPPMAFKNCLSEAAKFLSMQIKGKGKSTYTKHFEAGVMVLEPVMLGIHRDDVIGETLFVPSNGKRGDGSRVDRTFPFISAGWTGTLTITVIDETITADVLRTHLEEAGKLIGVGRFRPRNNGYYGRFLVTSFEQAAA